MATAHSDYRESHLEKGLEYDSSLATNPWDRYMARQESAILKKLVQNLFASELIPRYLDFACGTGRITELLEEHVEVPVAVDVSERMLAIANAKCPKTNFYLRDITKESLDVEPFNLITAFRFFGNAQDELRNAALQAVHAMLTPNGYLIVNNHRNSQSIANSLRRLRGEEIEVDLSTTRLTRLLAEHNFQVVRTYGIGAWILRAKWETASILDSSFAKMIEPLSRCRPLGRYCPDALVVARKMY